MSPRETLIATIGRWETWGDVFTILVAIFVAGEMVASRLGRGAAEQLRKLDDAAAKTQEGAVETARREAAEANARAAEANRVAESERLARVRLETRLADRILTTDQVAAIVSRLEPLAGQHLNVFCPSSPEPIALANQLFTALQHARWNALLIPRDQLGRSVRGLIVETTPDADEPSRKAAKVLVDALTSAGLDAAGPAPQGPQAPSIGSGPMPDPQAKITISIGTK